MTYVINLADHQPTPVDTSLPRLEEVTAEFLDDLARRLQWDTFSETAKMTYDDAWQHHFAQLEIASICFHSQSGEATLPQKIIDNRLRFCEYQMQLLKDYGTSLNDDIRASERTDTVTEIGGLSHDRLTTKRDLLREQYAYIKNMHYVYLTKVRPEVEKRTGYTMSAYKSVKQLESEKKAKQYRMYRKRLTMDEWSTMSTKEKDEYLAKNAVVMNK